MQCQKRATRLPCKTGKTWLVCGLLLWAILAPLHAGATGQTAEPLTDGPHLFYLGNERIVLSLVNGEVRMQREKARGPLQLDIPAVPGLRVTVPGRPGKYRGNQIRTTEKVFAISDVHGQFFRMKEILVGNRVMDDGYHWIFKRGHLVFVGDVFDRGPRVSECLWLLFHLERAAAAAGGRVHLLLGNHDQMVMRGDLRYVNERYLKISKMLKNIRYQDLFGPDTFLGKWLRTRPAIIRINDTLFVHAGVHPRLVEKRQSISSINRTIRRHMDSRSYIHSFHPMVSFLFGRNGVFWSRGYFQEEGYDPINERQLLRILKFYKASRVVVGHTRHDLITTYMGGLVIGTAVNTEEDQPAQGLLIRNGRFFRADANGNLSEITQNTP